MTAVPRVALAALVVIAFGCSSTGRRFDPDSVPKIRPGVTTARDVQRWFGEPTSVETRGTGGMTWGYRYETQQRRDTRTITKIGRSIASIFGWRTFFPPVDVAYSNRTRHNLRVYFDENSVVRDYTYNRTDEPSQRVY